MAGLACLLGILCGFLTAHAQAAGPAARLDPDFLIDTWQTEDGLPEDSATAMVQDRGRYLWFGTFRGLVRFDGTEFTRFDKSNTPQLPSDGIVNLHLDRSGRLWVSTYEGVVARDVFGWRTMALADAPANDPVRTFSERANGDLLLTTFNGRIVEYVGGTFRQLPPPPGPAGGGYLGHADEQGRWWAVRQDFIGHWDGGRWQPAPGLGQGADGCAPARDGGVWLLRWPSLVKCRKGVEVRQVDLPEPPGSFWAMSEDSDGNVWIATIDKGVCRISPTGAMRRWNTGNGLAYDGARFVFEDAERNLWVGTSGGGLQRFKARRFRSIGVEQGLTERNVRSVSAGPDGSVWIGTYGKGLFRWRDGAAENVALPGWAGGQLYVQSVLADRRGRVWVGTFAHGLWVLEAGRSRRIPADETGGDNVVALFEDSRGRVWINGGRTVALFDGKSFHTYAVRARSPVRPVRFAEDGEGAIWLGGGDGVFRFFDGSLAEVTEGGRPIRGATCIASDAGVVWIAGPGNALLCYRGGVLKRIGAAASLPAEDVQAIVGDATGYLWMASRRGITRVARDDLLSSADCPSDCVTFQTFDAEDGLPGVQFPGDTQPACVRDKAGRLWFATSRGVATTDPAALRLNLDPPPVNIQSVAYHLPGRRRSPAGLEESAEAGTRVVRAAPFTGPLLLPPGSRRLELRFSAVSLASPSKVRYQVRLENTDSNWHDVGTQRTMHYYAPRPGRYTFRVRAVNGDGAWNPMGATFAFTVQPYFWQTKWFFAAAVLFLVGGGAGAAWALSHTRHRRARGRLERRQRQSEALLMLSASPALATGDLPRAFREIAETVARVLDVPDVAVCVMDDEQGVLRCAEALGTAPGGTDPPALEAARFPAYFRALRSGRAIDAMNARNDANTAELADDYLAPRGITSILEAPARAHGRVVGTVRCEHRGAPRKWHEDEVGFAVAAGDQLAQALLNAERERANRAVRESEERFRLLADATPILIWCTGVDKRCDFVNAQWLRFTGRTMEQEAGEGWSQGVHPDDVGRCLETYFAAFDARESFQMEYRLRRADGEYRWVLDSGVPRFGPDGRFAGYVGSAVDVTERRLSAEALRQSEERFRQVVEAAPSAILMVGRDGRIALANAQAERVFGYARQDLLGTDVEQLIPPRYRSGPLARRDSFFAQTPDGATGVGRETYGMRKAGDEFPVEVRLSPIRTRDGPFILASIVDITDRVTAELESQQQRAALAHLSRVTMLGELSGSLAHELNQPLTAILSNAQAAQRFMARDDFEPDELRAILADIVAEDKRAGEVIRRLRLLLKKGEVSHQPLDVNEVVQDVLKLMRSDLVYHNVTVETDLRPDLPRVSGDRVQLQQVLLNLVMNACDAVKPNAEGERLISVSTGCDGDSTVRTTVSDRGSGISPHQMNRIFEPFFTTKSDGMGLGLVVCRTIVGAHGGTLSAENNDGRGASFHMTLQPAGSPAGAIP